MPLSSELNFLRKTFLNVLPFLELSVLSSGLVMLSIKVCCLMLQLNVGIISFFVHKKGLLHENVFSFLARKPSGA